MAAAATRTADGVGRIPLATAAAGLSFGVALIHGSVMVQHFREWWLFGLFFAIVTPLQLAWAVAVWHDQTDRSLLWVGAAANLAVASVWAVSRITGLPFGPETFHPEALGFKDVLATADEFSIAVLVALLLLRRDERPGPQWLRVGAWILVAASVLGASLAGH